MAEMSAFALRMPPEFKAAAKALTKVYFYEWRDEDEKTERGVNPVSINEAIIYLMSKGLKQTLTHIDRALKDEAESVAVFQEMMTFFMQAPAANEVRPANLPEGSAARKMLEEWAAEHDAHTNSDSEYFDADDRPEVMTRRDVTNEYSSHQNRMFALTEVKGAIQKALTVRV